MEKKEIDYEFKDQKILPRNMEKEVRQSFIEYSMSVIVSRALPDVRDGMKPGQRRILYAMYEDRLTSDKPFRKSATTVGNVLGRYHPHGDAAVYGTMVRMAQDFSMRYPLIEGHGNFGNVDGDGAAAYRYTEARMAKISNELMSDIEKDVVDFVPNFDNRLREPSVLPSRFPNLLVNGSVGIAVGMATYIPTHNLREVIDGTLYLMDNPEADVDELMQFIKGPDFPTAATIYGTAGIRQAYATGKGHVMVRSRAKIEDEQRRIIVTEIPYQVNKSQLIKAMAQLVRDKRIDGITDIRDESGRDGMRIVIEYRRDANGEVILNQLYKYTQLQDTCAINMLALVNNEPKILPLKAILDEYIRFQEEVVTRRTRFDLKKTLAEAHIFEGYKIAIDDIDEVIALIKQSPSTPEAKEALKVRFNLSDEQAQAIVDMTLGRLSGMERQKVEDRIAKLHATIERLKQILADEGEVRRIVKEELTVIRDKYGDDRRTDIVEAAEDIDLEDLIEKHFCVVTRTHAGYIKRIPVDTYTAQRRGGKGIVGMATKEEDYIESICIAHSHAYLLLFTNNGKIFVKKTYMLPEAGRTAKGSNLVNLIELGEGEKVTTILPIRSFEDAAYLTFVTKQGIIKRTKLSEYEYQRKGGKIAINLDEGDELIFVGCTDGERDILITTVDGQGVRFSEQKVSVVGRTARGVKAIELREGDSVCSVSIVNDELKMVTITENGFGKRSEFSDFEARNRGTIGVICQNLNEKTGKLAGAIACAESDDLMIITDEGVVIRTPVADIPTYNRTATGVHMMRLGEGAKIVNVARVESEETIEEEAENAEVPDEEPEISEHRPERIPTVEGEEEE